MDLTLGFSLDQERGTHEIVERTHLWQLIHEGWIVENEESLAFGRVGDGMESAWRNEEDVTFV